jgi:hypothetical protein
MCCCSARWFFFQDIDFAVDDQHHEVALVALADEDFAGLGAIHLHITGERGDVFLGELGEKLRLAHESENFTCNNRALPNALELVEVTAVGCRKVFFAHITL